MTDAHEITFEKKGMCVYIYREARVIFGKRYLVIMKVVKWPFNVPSPADDACTIDNDRDDRVIIDKNNEGIRDSRTKTETWW